MLIDSYAWVEFFDGTQKGKRVENILKEACCYTSGVCLAEISEVCERRGWLSWKIIAEIKKLSTIILPDEKILQASLNVPLCDQFYVLLSWYTSPFTLNKPLYQSEI